MMSVAFQPTETEPKYLEGWVCPFVEGVWLGSKDTRKEHNFGGVHLDGSSRARSIFLLGEGGFLGGGQGAGYFKRVVGTGRAGLVAPRHLFPKLLFQIRALRVGSMEHPEHVGPIRFLNCFGLSVSWSRVRCPFHPAKVRHFSRGI